MKDERPDKKSFFAKLFDFHDYIGKILKALCLIAVVAAIIGLAFGLTKCSKNEQPAETNHFICEDVLIHDSNYTVNIPRAYSTNTITILDKNNKIKELKGLFICVEISIFQDEDSKLESHTFDYNDFKLKNHTGVYMPLNEIMGAIGWDGIDIHIDEKDGNHIMSSVDFDTIKSVKDYNYIKKTIEPGTSFNFTIYFEMEQNFTVEENLMVFEIDFYTSMIEYKKGTDIILLPRPIKQ